MPFYEYECSSCRFYTEILRKISDPPLRKCPSCGKNTFKRLISAPVFRLKGSGWYETDFKGDKESKRNLAGSDGEDKKADDKKTDDKKGETKTEAKAEAKVEPKAEPKTEAKAESKPDSKPESRTEKKTEAKPAARKSTAKTKGRRR